MSTIPDVGEAADGVKVVGLLGFDFIAELLLRLDYEHESVTASNADLQVAALPRGGIDLDVRLGDQIPLASVDVNGSTGERFALDTGDQGGLMIADYFARRFPHALADHGPVDRNVRLTGVGGEIDVRPVRLANVRIGSVTFKDFVAFRIADRKQYSGDYDGAIGAEELRFFTVWLDYAQSRVVLVPNADGRRAMR